MGILIIIIGALEMLMGLSTLGIAKSSIHEILAVTSFWLWFGDARSRGDN